MTSTITILGGGYGGALAAARIAKSGVPVTLVDSGAGLVERIRLHQVAAGDDLAPVAYERLFRGLPVEHVQARVTRIDRAHKRVIADRGELAYAKLVYALGSEINTPEHATSVGDPLAVRARLRTAQHIVIVGGGLTGIETASEIAERFPDRDITMIDSGIVGEALSSRARKHLHDWLDAHHVTRFENTRVDAVLEEGVRLEDGQTLFADLVLWCGSFRLSPIARESGLAVNERGQILVDPHLRSSDPDIYAVGDAAAIRDRRMSCALALPMGGYVADFLTGATDEPFRFGFAVQCISLGRHDGIIDFVNADDSPRNISVVGRPAAWVKEMICRYTILSLRLETRGIQYGWPKAELAA
jgi:NADH dehydrogenase FAD-containing subunit